MPRPLLAPAELSQLRALLAFLRGGGLRHHHSNVIHLRLCYNPYDSILQLPIDKTFFQTNRPSHIPILPGTQPDNGPQDPHSPDIP